MTQQEVSERYGIPIKILEEYKQWGLCGAVRDVMDSWQFDDLDIDRLSMIMTLHDIGFETEEVEAYIRLMLQGESTQEQRLDMLAKKRGSTLDEIHFKENQIARLDYLRHEMNKK